MTLILGIGAGFAGAKGISVLLGGLFSRKNLDKIALEYAKDYKMKDLVTDETLIVSLDYNSQQPRMYSKYFDRTASGVYNQTVA